MEHAPSLARLSEIERRGETRWFCLGEPSRAPTFLRRWTELAERCPWATPFQHPDWMLPWLRAFGPTRQWWLGLLHGDRMVALAPLFVYDRDGERVVTQLGAGITDRLDMLLAPGWHVIAENMLVQALTRLRAAWDVCEFQELSGVCPLATARLPAGWQQRWRVQSRCPLLSRETEPGAGFPVPAGHAAKAARAYRRLMREGHVRFERTSGDRSLWLFERLIALHGARWSDRGHTGGIFADPVIARFHRQVLTSRARTGGMGLYGLWLDDALIAAVYLLERWPVAFFYVCGFDPRFARLSPMTVLLKLVLEDYTARGYLRLDFLRGEEPYKYWWGAADRITLHRQVRSRAFPASQR